MWVIHLNKRNSYPATVIKRVPELSTDVALTSANHDEEDTLLRKQQAAPQQFSCSWLTIVVLLAVVSQICSIDRMAMSVAVLPMSDEYGWPNSVKGAVNGAFNIGYTFTNLFGGYLAAAYGPQQVLGFGVLIWSGFTVLTPLAAATGQLWILLLVRAVMGVGEGVAFPCVQVLVKTWVPADRRARSLSLIYSGHQLGSIISLLASPGIIYSFGWAWVFYFYGFLGFVWLALWQPLVFPAPGSLQSSAAMPAAHYSKGGSPANVLRMDASATTGSCGATGVYDESNAKQPDESCKILSVQKPVRWADVPWTAFLRQPACWALLVAHGSFGVCYNVAMSWLPAYYNSQFGVDVRQSAHMSVMPFAVMAVTTNLSGWIADGLVNSGCASTTKARKLMQSVGTSVPAICLLHLAAQHRGGTIYAAMALLAAVLGGLGFQGAGFASNHQDISTRYAGILYGVTNAASSFAGSVAVYGVGVVLDRTQSSWGLVFNSVAWVQMLSLVVYVVFATSVPLFE